jgi:hypothetical protein
VIGFAETVHQNAVTLPLASQLVRAGTSVGANYCEADDAVKLFSHNAPWSFGFGSAFVIRASSFDIARHA